ncbi:MAG: hypothetical protein A3B96_01390 [Candidatus Spechtbacteria bacterium RIFCSPHIGHO2_02_FULL_43_15b]|uniref:Uncharacterized protein n=1 Tax=Candidatus Spechtbacteria bacterium RIFCSPHIGHO2_01_FULL_43_30 TaxID=1802158 RepID=A0A1G2H655_9BACT|nr:MAG: hypothetical protein A2827_00310 [Candidatus Spechtbacteria bacterium RIFCSPHIGHO2_01_FULL_43_30]OGZ59064.1 MAG: hypothetical protein A3B96_01390 [Candidatus Spechtbacteria bacterium RIFCSPHIGHO2_02_FULL_43_15b]
MDEAFIQRAVELCLAVYRVTEKFPENEVLRRKFRELSIDLLSLFCYYIANPTSKSRLFICSKVKGKIIEFDAYSQVVRVQVWVNPANFEILRKEYENLASGLEMHKNSDNVANVKYKKTGISNRKELAQSKLQKEIGERSHERQDFILKLLERKKGGASNTEIAKSMKTSKKTAERHLKYLLEKGAIIKEGRTRNARFFGKKSRK